MVTMVLQKVGSKVDIIDVKIISRFGIPFGKQNVSTGTLSARQPKSWFRANWYAVGVCPM